MKRRFWVVISLLMVCCLLPWNAFAGLYWGEVVRITSKTSANVYETANRTGFIGEAQGENTYDYLGTTGDWHHIQFNRKKDGYVSAKYSVIEPGLVWRDGPGEVEAVVRNTHYNALNVRDNNSLRSNVLGELRVDAVLPYCGDEDGWRRVWYYDDYAYIASNRTTIEVVGEKPDTAAGATAEGGIGTDIDAYRESRDFPDCAVCENTRLCPTCRGMGHVYGSVQKAEVECPSCCGLSVCYACYDNSK